MTNTLVDSGQIFSGMYHSHRGCIGAWFINGWDNQ